MLAAGFDGYIGKPWIFINRLGILNGEYQDSGSNDVKQGRED